MPLTALTAITNADLPTIKGGIGGVAQTVPPTEANETYLAAQLLLAIAKINECVAAINAIITVGAVAAAGTNQATAAALAEGINVVSAADDAKGVLLPAATAAAGQLVIVKSTVANKILKVYPASGDIINALSADAAISLASGPTVALFFSTSASQWYTLPLLPS